MRPSPNKANAGRGSNPFSPKRHPGNRTEKTRILIVGEGQETEPNYFRHLRNEPVVRERYAITVKGAHGFSQDEVVKETVGFKRNGTYDEVWCVVDVEGPSKSNNLAAACKLAAAHNITLWLSNPSIEVWFLLHLVRQAREYSDGDAAEEELKTHWRKCFGQGYIKTDDGIYARLRSFLGTAIENARWVLETHHGATSSKDCNSSTDLYRVILRLMPDGIEKIERDQLQAGATAPDFQLKDQNGRQVQLSSLRGKAVILFFHPTVSERASITEVYSFRNAKDGLGWTDAVILGISPDPVTTLQEFVGQNPLPFQLLSDMDHSAGQAYGVWSEKPPSGKENMETERATFVIGPDGILVRIFHEVDVRTHADQVLEVLRELGTIG